MSRETQSIFDLSGKVAVITGGAGMLGQMHAETIVEAGGIPVLADLRGDGAKSIAKSIDLDIVISLPLFPIISVR